jgi:signal transduction histidine kinase
MLACRSSQLLLFMINDIFDFTQISNGKLRINPSRFCVMTIVKEVSKLIKFGRRRRG